MNDQSSRLLAAATRTTTAKVAPSSRRAVPGGTNKRIHAGERKKIGLALLVLLLAVAFGGGNNGEQKNIAVSAFSPLLSSSCSPNTRRTLSSFHSSSSSLTVLTATVMSDNESFEATLSLSKASSTQKGPLQIQDNSDNYNIADSDNAVDPFMVGAVVRPRYLDKAKGGAAAAGKPRDGVLFPPPPSRQPSLLSSTTATAPSILAPAKCMDDDEDVDVVKMRRRNIIVAVASIALAISNYIYQFLHPLTPLQLLVDMQSHSAPISIIGKNPKPTVVDFWAPWCENCQRIAPALHELEKEYGNDINFVMINGDDPTAWPYIQALGVDAIPHLALVTADGYVQTALIGPVPRHVLQEDFQAMVHKSTILPHVMLDVFAGAESPEARRVSF